jgi:hypothetical protein
VVKATNSNGDSESSDSSAAAIPFGKPGAPRSANLAVTSNGSGEMTQSWVAPASNGGRAVTSYNYEFTQGSNGTGSQAGTTRAAQGAPGTTYQFKVQACSEGGCGPWVDSNAASPSSPPPWAPSNYPTTTIRRTCPEPASTYNNPPSNAAQGCGMSSYGYVASGTLVDAVCVSVRNGDVWFYFLTENTYQGWFIYSGDTNRGRNIPDC